MDSNQWAKELEGVKAMAEIGPSTSSRGESSSEKKVRPHKDQVVNCPRCNSTNTKFCYYNNYSLTQPRYFCKTCRRYWTEGGTLRNVPVGGGSRKNRRSNISTSSPATTQKIPDANRSNISQFSSPNSNNNKIHEGHDLNLATFPYAHYGYQFPPQVQLFEFPRYNESTTNIVHELKPTATSNSTPFAALELLRSNGFNSSSGMNSSHITTASASSSNGIHSTGLLFQDLNPGLSFSVDHRFGSSNRYNGENGIQESNEKMMFHMEEAMKQNSGTRSDGVEQNKGQELSNGCWNGMLGGGQW